MKNIDKIINDNCKEVPYEGTAVDKLSLKEDIKYLIEYHVTTALTKAHINNQLPLKDLESTLSVYPLNKIN